MVGANEIVLNQASMNAALQEWADAHITDEVCVTGVSYDASRNVFKVRTESEAEEPT